MQSKNNIVSINADEALQRLYSIQGAKIPQELDIQSFMNTLDSIVNKDNFIAHLQKKNDSQNRLAYLNLVEPTLNKWDLKLTSGDRTDLIKVFNDGKNFFTLLITAENNKRLITFLPKAREDYIANKIKNADHIQTFISRASKENEWTRNANPTTKQEISKDIESKSTQEIEKKERMHRGVYSVYYDDIMIDFVKKYDPDDDLWFMKHAKLEYSDNGEEVYAALKHFNEVRDNVSTTYDDYVAATEKVKNSLNRAALDIIDDFKATDEALEAIEKIQTKLLDDYPQTNKNISINTRLEKDSMQIESKSTQEPVTQKETQENTQAINQSEGIREQNQHLHLENLDTTRFFETINNMQGKNLSKKDKIQLFDSFTSALQSRQDLIIDEIERILKHANKSGDRKHKDFSDLDEYAMKEIFFKLKNKDLYDDYESILKDLKANKDIDWDKSIFKEFQNTEKGIALSNNKISSGVAEDFAKSLKEWELDNNHIVNKFKDTIQSQNTKDTHANTKQDTNTTNHTEKETSTKESHTDNQHEATQRESGADTKWATSRTSNNPQENKDTETTLKRDNGISDEYSPSTKEMAQSGNEKTHEKRDIRDDSSHSSSDIETNANISRDTQGHNAGIRLDETDNKRYKHDGNDDRDNSRTRIHRNVSLKKKGKKDSNTNTESKVATQDIDTQSTPQVKPKKLTDKEIIDNFLKEYDNHEYGSKEISLIKNIDKPENLMYIAKAIKDFNEARTLQDDILKIDTKAIADAGVLTLEERQQLGRGMGDLLPTLKEAFHYLHKAPYPAEIYKISNIKKRKEVKKAYNLVQEKGLHRFDYPQTNKDVSLNAQHDKETPKTTKEIIKEAKASGKSVRETQELIDKNKATETFTDSYGKTHEIPKDIADNWKNTFNLKSLDEAYIPNFTPEVKQALDSILQGEDIKLSAGSLVKLIQRDRLEFLPYIKDTLESPQVVVRQVDGALIFAKDFRDDKLGKFFASVSKNDNGEWVISSNAPKNLNNLQNKIKEGGEVLYSDLPELPIIAKPELPAKALNSEANADNIIPQKPKPKQSPKELDNIESDSNPAGILNPEELATLNKEFKLGEIQDLKGQKALYDANIESLSLLDDILKSGRVATDDEKKILSNFRGFGKASNELYQVIKEKGERLDSLNKLLESLSESVGAKIDADYLFRRAGDAYYTPTPIVESMVKLAKDLGLNNNHVILEPSSGSGRFLGQFHSNANVVGIELDPFTAKLSQTIYPYFKIDNAGFQNSKFAKDDFYDLVIGNPPYSNFTIRDEAFSASAHNYFMKRGIDKLRVGGISIQIVTKSFMDSSNDLVRKEIAKNAKFLGGVRLPNNAFKDASVTTDILVFKKVSAAEAKKLDNSWIETTELNGIPVSKYFVDNPQNVLGEMKVGKGQFGDIVHVINKEGIDFSNFDLMPYLNKKYDFDTLRLKDNNTHSLKDLESEVKTTQDITDSQMGAVRYDKEQDKFIKNDGGSDDELDLKEYLQSLEVTWKPETIEKRIAEYKELAPKISELQSTLKSLQKAELDSEASNETISALRQKLNSDYEAVVGKNGSFYTKDKKVSPRFKLFEMVDDTSFEIFALEKAPLVKNNKVVGAERADIFTKRVSYPYVRPQSADNLHDAMHISLNETGYNDYQRIADLLGSDVDSVKKEFLDKKLEYLDHNGERLNKDIFLSGDVKTRLESFHDEYGLPKFSDDETIAHYQKIAYEDLKNVIPDDIEVPHIEIPLGANWLDKNITDSFLSEIVGLDYLNTNYIHGAGWKVNFDGLKDRDFMIATGKDFKANTGVEYINGIDYIEDMLNNKTLVVQKTIKGDKDKTIIYRDPIATQSLEALKKQLKREFKQYILDNDNFSEIAQKQYNDTFNREVARKYDGSHLKLHGANSDIELRKHQKNAVFRFFQELSSLLAHDVGTGKSYTMIASAIEGKRLKVHNKPMIVLPNHVAPQIAAEARRLYPNANIKLIQAVSRKDKNRQLASLKNNSHDIIITTYTAFTNMNVAPSAFKDYINMEVEHLKNIYYQLEKSGEASKRELNSIANRIEKAEERATNYAKSVANDKQNVFFEDLGIDTLMFDEAHYLKNLPIFTAQRNVRGIGSADSQRAIDAFMKISQMRDLPNNRVLFATGTPITNFISDIFTMQRFLGSKDLEAKGIDVFDEWCKMFAGASSEFEMKATGEYKLTSRLRDFSNLPELKAMYYKFADLVTKEDMQKAILEEGGKIIEPKVRRIPVVLKRNQAQIDFMESVKKRAKVLQENPQAAMEKGGDNMLKIISDSNKASIDMRLIDSSYKRDENGKISAAANNILEVYNDFNEHKGTQLVFLDTSVPKKAVKPETLEKWQKELERIDSVIQNQSHNLSDNQLEKLRDKASDLESKIARGSDGFSAYNDLKDLLIEKGIKENEVAFVHDFEGIKKETLSQKINSGEIRVLIGSTSKMGAGSNFQERLAAIHHLDLDWTPANMEQREGRIIRQGNRLMDLVPDFEARIYTYVTEQMSDSLMLQTLEQKTKIIKQIQDPNLKTRVIEDISEDNLHGRLKAMTSPNAEQEVEAMNIVKSIDEVENAISTHDLILKNNHNKIENANKLESSMQKDINTLEAFKKQTQDNTTISFGKEKVNFAKDNKAKTSKDNKTDTPKATKDKDKKKEKEKSPETLANEKLNAIIQDFAKSSDNIKVICEYRGLNILAKKGYSGMIDFYLGKDLNESLSISTRLDVRDAAYTDKNYMQRFHNGYNKLISDDYIKELQGQIQKAKDTREKAKKAYEKEIANKESVAELRNSLNEMLVRQAELHSFLGRASDSEIERLKAIYGDDFEDIVKGKFSKESENKALDNNTANNIAENDLEQTLESTMQKFNYDERKAKDLLEWHKDSSPLTKDENGLPKVFYHGSGAEFEVFEKEKDRSGLGFWFALDKDYAKEKARFRGINGGILYEVFLHVKKPLDLRRANKDYPADIKNELTEKGLNLNSYDTQSREAQDFLRSKGYDGIILDVDSSDFFVVFDSNQIKHIDNKGSYTDTKGNITKTKPKNKESTHTYFNDKSPNIMYANPKHLGAGILSGSAAGIETDENGNIVGFNPQNFVLGLIGGSVASKAISKLYNNESTQRYATLAIKSIQQDYKSLSENNPAMFAKIMQKFNPRDFLKGKKEINSLSNEIFNKELAKAIESALQNGKVETMPQAEFRNKEEFAKIFDSISGKYGIIETPYKEVKADIKSAWKHFTYNTHNTDRENIKGGFFKTFKDPLFIVEQAREGQSSPSVYFYKPFYDNDKKLMNLFGIGIDSVGNIDFKTYYFDKKENRLKEMLMSDKIKIVYMQENP
ncbi:PBECR2 nuclease fold domain-containing protein [Helicobacter rappini]|nr:PBECR2 nuclease fold domain-containing protein [Helicobacter rappini]